MNIASLRHHLPTQGTEKGREIAASMLRGDTLNNDQYKESALDQLSTVPEPWLERLQNEGMAYVALGYGEDLSQTDLIISYTPERLKKEAVTAKEIASKVRGEVDADMAKEAESETDAFRLAMLEHGRPELLKEKMAAQLEKAGLGFAVRVTRDLLPLTFLEQENGVEASYFDDGVEPHETERGLFREILLDLNGPEVVSQKGSGDGPVLPDDSVLDPADDVILVPYAVYGKKRLSPVSKESYSQINGMYMDQHHGGHFWPGRLIMLDDEAALHPSPIMSTHSVVLHETGHAIDYIAEGIPGLNHRETIDAMFESDMKRQKAGEQRVLTPRATDNAREFFAEAVEAYLTNPTDHDTYKADNHHVLLKEKNPELYDYVDRLMKLPAVNAISEAENQGTDPESANSQ